MALVITRKQLGTNLISYHEHDVATADEHGKLLTMHEVRRRLHDE
jgi:hypothetical protein